MTFSGAQILLDFCRLFRLSRSLDKLSPDPLSRVVVFCLSWFLHSKHSDLYEPLPSNAPLECWTPGLYPSYKPVGVQWWGSNHSPPTAEPNFLPTGPQLRRLFCTTLALCSSPFQVVAQLMWTVSPSEPLSIPHATASLPCFLSGCLRLVGYTLA